MDINNGVLSENNTEIPLLKDFGTIIGFKRVSKICELSLSRAIALACLHNLEKENDSTISALDAVNSFGAAGLQWAQHMSSKDVSITVNVATGIKKECESWLEKNNCTNNVTITSADPQVLMHGSKHKFVYLEVTGTLVPYIDAAVRCVNHNGLICATCTDTSTLYNKCPTTAQRWYGANLLKNEYFKETAIRVVVANIARSAARWNKGIKVELCAAAEPGFTVVCRVLRGPKHGDQSISSIKWLQHCQLCQARKFIQQAKYVTPTQDHIICECSAGNVQTPLLLLGPMWADSIFQAKFVIETFLTAKQLKLSSDNTKVLELMAIESLCCNSTAVEEKIMEEKKQRIEKNELNSNGVSIEPANKKPKMDSDTASVEKPIENHDDNESLFSLPHPSFYCDFQFHSVKGGNPPRLLAVLNELHNQGHRASKSHFGPRCVRTSATVAQFEEIIKQLWQKTPKKL